MNRKTWAMLFVSTVVVAVGAVGLRSQTTGEPADEKLTMDTRAWLRQLENRVGALEQEVRALNERVRTIEPAGKPVPPPQGSREAWRQLSKGMSTDEVRDLLGRPVKAETTATQQVTWRYDNLGAVHFKDGAVVAWFEPRGSTE